MYSKTNLTIGRQCTIMHSKPNPKIDRQWNLMYFSNLFDNLILHVVNRVDTDKGVGRGAKSVVIGSGVGTEKFHIKFWKKRSVSSNK